MGIAEEYGWLKRMMKMMKRRIIEEEDEECLR